MDAITEAYDGDVRMIDGTSVCVHHSAATLKTYGPPRWQVGCVRLCSVVHKRIRRSGTLALAMMEIRAPWPS